MCNRWCGSDIIHRVYDLSAYQDPVVEKIEVFNPLTRFDDEWAALIRGREDHEESFSVNRDGSLSITRR
jgi:hypothetical protein